MSSFCLLCFVSVFTVRLVVCQTNIYSTMYAEFGQFIMSPQSLVGCSFALYNIFMSKKADGIIMGAVSLTFSSGCAVAFGSCNYT